MEDKRFNEELLKEDLLKEPERNERPETVVKKSATDIPMVSAPEKERMLRSDQRQLRERIRSMQSPKRFLHTVSMTDMSVSLAECYGLDTDLVWETAMLHDIAKDMSMDEMIAYAKKHNHKIDDFSLRFPSNMHAEIGALVAEHEFGLKNRDALNAIRYHVSARPDMSLLEKIIYFSDFAEPGRPNYAMTQYLYRIAQKDISNAILRGMPILLSYQTEHDVAPDICEICTIALDYMLDEELKKGKEAGPDSVAGVEMLSDEEFDEAFALLKRNGLNLKSVKNIRSLGGFETKDGRRSVQGKIFRSADLSSLSKEDADYLKNEAGLSLVIDLRTEKEAEDIPDVMIPGVRYEHIPLSESLSVERMNSLTRRYLKGETEKERAWYVSEYARIDEIRRMYAGILTEPSSREAMRKVFKMMLEEEGSVLFHCSSGKDRSGVISAIFLYALGCDRADIIRDYNASAVVYMAIVESLKAELKEHGYNEELQMGVQTILGVVPEAIAAGFYYVDRNFASDQEMLMDVTGFNAKQLNDFREKFLEA